MSGLFRDEDFEWLRTGREGKDPLAKNGRSGQKDESRSTPAARKARLSRVATRTPEVMVKVTGHAKGPKQLKAHMDYMTRKSTLTAFNDKDEIITTADELGDIQEEWLNVQDRGRQSSRLTTNIALSIRNGDKDALLGAGRAFAEKNFAGHNYLIVMHTDTQHPHLHLTVRNRDQDGQRLHIAKGKPQEWRESFAEELRERGIAAEATSRAERGKTRKGERAGIRHIRERKTPDHDKSAVAEAFGKDNRTDEKQPWRVAIRKRQDKVRRQWRDTVTELEQGSPADQALADQARSFIEQMPPVETREDALRREIANSREKPQAKQNDQGKDIER